MAKYANRTCHNCGIRKPQPDMRRKDIYVETGRSRSGVSKGTVLASMLGDKKAEKKVYNSIWNLNQRTYQRKKTVWVCGGCYRKVGNGLGMWESIRAIFNLIVLALIVFFILFALASA